MRGGQDSDLVRRLRAGFLVTASLGRVAACVVVVGRQVDYPE